MTTSTAIADAIPCEPQPQQDAEALPSLKTVLHWLRDMAPKTVAPVTRPPVSLQDDLQNGQLYFSCYEGGGGLSLVLNGPADFITRWYNWAVNTCVIPPAARLNWHYEEGVGTLAYVCPPCKTRVLRGLAYQFRWEILRDGGVPKVESGDPEAGPTTVDWDDRALNRLAVAKARAFMRNIGQLSSLNLLHRDEPVAHFYDLTVPGRAETRYWEEDAAA